MRQTREMRLEHVADLETFLLGEWNVERLIAHRTAGEPVRFVGAATFAPSAPSMLSYAEHGILYCGGSSDVAWRHLRYELCEPGRALVAFEDGRAFHDLDLRRGRHRALHYCEADRYVGTFNVIDGALLVRWHAEGPSDAYVSTTCYTRVS